MKIIIQIRRSCPFNFFKNKNMIICLEYTIEFEINKIKKKKESFCR